MKTTPPCDIRAIQILLYFLSFLFQNGGFDYIKYEDADIFCVQETKCMEEDLPMVSHLSWCGLRANHLSTLCSLDEQI